MKATAFWSKPNQAAYSKSLKTSRLFEAENNELRPFNERTSIQNILPSCEAVRTENLAEKAAFKGRLFGSNVEERKNRLKLNYSY